MSTRIVNMPIQGVTDPQRWADFAPTEFERDQRRRALHGCGCTETPHPGETHDEHIDRLWRERNMAMLAVGQDTSVEPWKRLLALFGMAQEEQARCKWKLTWLREPESAL